MTFHKAARNAVFLYAATLSTTALGYVFWLTISALTGPETIGTIAAATAVGWIVGTIAQIGIPTGVQRFLGKAIAENDSQTFNRFTMTSIIIVSLAVAAASAGLLLLSKDITELLDFPPDLFLISIIMTAGVAIHLLFRGVVISTMNTRLLALAHILGEVARIVVSVVLIISFYETLGLIGGFFVLYATTIAILSSYIIRLIVKNRQERSSLHFKDTAAELVKAGTVSWIPTVITQVGTQMGFLFIFGLSGAFDTGLYFISYALYSILFAIPNSILSVAYPMMSGMNGGKEQFLSMCIKIGLIVSIPSSVAFIVYADPILGLFGNDFRDASTMTLILLIGVLPATVNAAIIFLAYTNGKYRYVLIIGLLTSIPRLALYSLLVPEFGGLGASMAFSIGSIIALIGSVLFAYRMNFRPSWLGMGIIALVPAAIGLFMIVIMPNIIFGIPLILGLSWLLYLKLNIIKVEEIRNISSSILPSNASTAICNSLERIDKFFKI